MEDQRPKVGIGVIIFRDRKVLLGKRKNAHGAGEYAFPGGHLEYGESFEECARRETLEEAGIKITNIKFQFLRNSLEDKSKHYIHVVMIADWESGEPATLEPEKCEGWGWYDLDNLPSPLFKLTALAFEAFKTGKNYF